MYTHKELKNVKLHLANTIYIQDGFELLTEFLAVGSNVYKSSISKLDFKHNIDAAEKINAWVKAATNNKISNLVTSGELLFICKEIKENYDNCNNTNNNNILHR